ncbi:MAG: phytanoyl-CoA dioxygenase family protein [Candidatus Poribacteria bacterium]|nr:phytanoyl-CoA dioxygenase family protein [Candidatus Poribacteria bacterium]
MALTPQQYAFFESFGYLVLPGLLTDDIDWMTEEHRAIFERKGMVHDGTKRSQIVPFIDQSERLCTLLDHPKVLEVLKPLLGDDFNYVGGDGNYYSGDTAWHSDGGHRVGLYAKFHLYLDPLTRDTGCIRMIPGSHLFGEWRDHVEKVRRSNEVLGISGRDVPCVAVENEPGDVVIFNHNIYHAAFGGGPARRHFDLNVARRAKTEAEIRELDNYLKRDNRPRYYPRAHSVHSDIMRETASPARMRHLEQVIERERTILTG